MIYLKKMEGMWRLKLDDVAIYDHGNKDYFGANYAAKPRSKADRYIDLHERLSHQSWKVIAEYKCGYYCTGGERYRREVYMYCMYVCCQSANLSP